MLLKTEVVEALQEEPPPPVTPEFKQMCLVLQSVHKTPPTEQFFMLQSIVKKVVHPYLVMVARPHPSTKAPSEPLHDGECVCSELVFAHTHTHTHTHTEPLIRSVRAETVVVKESPELKVKSGHRRVRSVGHSIDLDQPTDHD